MSKVNDRLLGHAEDNDGIDEYDNPLPDWWLGLFFFSVVFAVGYTIEYHALSKRSQAAAYDAQMLAAAERWPQQAAPATLSYDPETLQAGEQVYVQTCASCHGAELTGGIGPNLVDGAWIHGGTEADVIRTITDGIPAKGMPAWGSILGGEKVGNVAAFVLNAAGGPAPAGSTGGTAGGAAPGDAGGAEGTAAADDAPEDAVALADAGEAGDGGGSGEAVADAGGAPSDGPVDLEAGKLVYAQNCAACHAPDLTGGVGPSLVDDEWIHGGELEQIEATIKHGVPAKGMIAWEAILGAEKIRQVAAYVHAQAQGE